jgi:hypothetical protein
MLQTPQMQQEVMLLPQVHQQKRPRMLPLLLRLVRLRRLMPMQHTRQMQMRRHRRVPRPVQPLLLSLQHKLLLPPMLQEIPLPPPMLQLKHMPKQKSRRMLQQMLKLLQMPWL